MNRAGGSSETKKMPRFSLVIPTYQRPENLRLCLAGIAALSAEKETFEVIVVDDGSERDPAKLVDEFRSELSVTVLYQESNQGPAAARNRGAAEARGEYLAFIDDDCVPCRNWLCTLDGHLGQDGNRAIGGNSLNALGDNLWSEAQQMLLDYLNQYFNVDPARARFCPSNNLVVPREHFLQIGGFDTSFPFAAGEDRDFSNRWVQSGARMCFVTDAPVKHHHAMSFKDFLRLHQRYGRGARRYHERADKPENGSYFEPFRFYAGLIFFSYSQTGFRRATTIMLAQLLSQLAHTVGYVQQAMGAE